MTDQSRIDDLRRRVRQDPASIAFAQLAEEYRRAGQLEQAVATCHAGLATHPEYISARVTLGRALLTLGRLDEAVAELTRVLASAPENLAAVRALGEAYRRQGRVRDALAHYTTALTLAPNDPDLERLVRDLGHGGPGARGPEPDPVRAEPELARTEPEPEPEPDPARAHALATVAALEQWLEAIDATRTERRA
ncbi:MAG TPA: tetratricopeptide repeat protein [Vicinamibacterales bacterium]|nr:tetratricopeptide repeat protein [Vicinamibacterales bacterium]